MKLKNIGNKIISVGATVILPGETKEVRFMLDRKDMELLNAKNDWVVEPGDFTVLAGANAGDLPLRADFRVV